VPATTASTPPMAGGTLRPGEAFACPPEPVGRSRPRQDRTGQAGFQPAGIGRFQVAGSGKGVLAAMPPGRAGGMLGV
jgi:hypothetical protein